MSIMCFNRKRTCRKSRVAPPLKIREKKPLAHRTSIDTLLVGVLDALHKAHIAHQV